MKLQLLPVLKKCVVSIRLNLQVSFFTVLQHAEQTNINVQEY